MSYKEQVFTVSEILDRASDIVVKYSMARAVVQRIAEDGVEKSASTTVDTRHLRELMRIFEVEDPLEGLDE